MKFNRYLTLTAVIAAAALALPNNACAESYDTDDSDNPLRLLFVPFHAYGKLLEYTVTRPAHYIISQPKCRYIFGKVSNPRTDDYWGDWDLYQRYSY